MLLHENKSYLDNQSIQAGLAMEKLNHIIVDRYFTEEEKAANLKFHETASREERTKMIADWKSKDKHDIDIIIEKLIATLGDAKYHFALIRSEFGHLRIEPYKEATEAEISNVLDVLRGIDIANRWAIVNYSTKYDDAACKEKAREIYQKNDGKFVTYCDWIGRLKYNEAENFYYFMKKGARSKGYYINERQICTGVKEV
jgi:hypothetical protein